LNKNSFTLIEILVVIIIIGILASLALPGFGISREGVLDKEAKTNLSFIQEAERFYKMEAGSYYPASGNTGVIADINTNLKISLPTTGSIWSYNVDTDNSQATASRLPSSSRVWTLTFTGSAPTCTGTGCPP
jgi:prepilin-type N-terminal cleavage/methylation domain-containing protein